MLILIKKNFLILYSPFENSTTRIVISFNLVFSYFTGFNPDFPPDGMMCTNVSMWSDVYWTSENVSECACEIKTKEVVEMKKVNTLG